MGNAKKCDRCSDFYDIPESNDIIEITVDYGPDIGRKKLDLCDKCYLELRLWTGIAKIYTGRKRNDEGD